MKMYLSVFLIGNKVQEGTIREHKYIDFPPLIKFAVKLSFKELSSCFDLLPIVVSFRGDGVDSGEEEGSGRELLLKIIVSPWCHKGDTLAPKVTLQKYQNYFVL